MAAAPTSKQVSRPRGRSAEGRRHCWIALDGLEPMPGVIAGWRRTEGGGSWEARVSYVLGDETGVVTGWLPASVLRPHHATPTA